MTTSFSIAFVATTRDVYIMSISKCSTPLGIWNINVLYILIRYSDKNESHTMKNFLSSIHCLCAFSNIYRGDEVQPEPILLFFLILFMKKLWKNQKIIVTKVPQYINEILVVHRSNPIYFCKGTTTSDVFHIVSKPFQNYEWLE